MHRLLAKFKKSLLPFLRSLLEFDGWFSLAERVPFWKEAILSFTLPLFAGVWADIEGASNSAKAIIVLLVGLIILGLWAIWLGLGAKAARSILWILFLVAASYLAYFSFALGTYVAPQLPQTTALPSPAAPEVRLTSRVDDPSRQRPQQARRDPVEVGSMSTGSVTIQPGAAASFGQRGGITASRVEVNPLPPEQTWELAVRDCDRLVEQLDSFSKTSVSIGAFISNNDGMRVAKILAAYFAQSEWDVSVAVLPVDPDGVVIGASSAGPVLTVIEEELRSFGLRVTKRDIRPDYQDSIGVVVGTSPIVTNRP